MREKRTDASLSPLLSSLSLSFCFPSPSPISCHLPSSTCPSFFSLPPFFLDLSVLYILFSCHVCRAITRMTFSSLEARLAFKVPAPLGKKTLNHTLQGRSDDLPSWTATSARAVPNTVLNSAVIATFCLWLMHFGVTSSRIVVRLHSHLRAKPKDPPVRSRPC